MSYLINGTTMPRPNAFSRDLIEKSGKVVTLDNTTKKDITGRKEKFTLEFNMLTQAEIATIYGIYNTLSTVTFQVTETNLTIASTVCHMTISSREYNTPGNEYREDIVMTLEEVN